MQVRSMALSDFDAVHRLLMASGLIDRHGAFATMTALQRQKEQAE